MKRKHTVIALFIILVAASAFAHGGHVHTTIMGTVTMVHESHLMLKTTDGKDVTVTLTDATTYTKGDKAAKRADLAEGVRVVIVLEADGKTAESVKIGTPAAT